MRTPPRKPVDEFVEAVELVVREYVPYLCEVSSRCYID